MRAKNLRSFFCYFLMVLLGVVVLFFSSVSFANNSQLTSLNLSPNYKVFVETSSLAGATVIPSGSTSLLVVFKDKSYFDATVVTHDLEGLPENFDLRLYPEYLLGIKSIKDLPEDIRRKFEFSACEIAKRTNNAKPLIESKDEKTIFTVTYGSETMILVSLNRVSDQVLLINTNGINVDKIKSILKGV